MGIRSRLRALEYAARGEREREELLEIFLQNTAAIRGEGPPHPKSHDPRYTGTFFSAPIPHRVADLADGVVEDLSE